jgi:hypothetical protein
MAEYVSRVVEECGWADAERLHDEATKEKSKSKSGHETE